MTAVVTDSVNLSQFVRVGRYDLPLPAEGATNELALEVSAITYNWDSETLFLLGDEGTSIVEVSKTGVLISTMAITAGLVTDPEGLTYIGGGQFVLVEERTRTAHSFTYEAGGTLEASEIDGSVKLGTTIGNVGLEGLSYDTLSSESGFVFVKEKTPQGVFQSDLNFTTGTATNGSAVTENSVNLFDPALLSVTDIADVFALSLLPSLDGSDEEDNLLLLSQESGVILEVNRSTGAIESTLVLQKDSDNPLSVVDQGHEGLVMDRDGFLYVVSEQGGGANTPQLWVFQLASFENAAPTALGLANEITSLAENSNTSARLKVADLVVTDDGIGTNSFSVSGTDAAFFEADATGLFIKAGTVLDFETKASYSVTVNVDDTGVGATPDASAAYSLTLTNVVNESPAAAIYISEVAPWSSGNSAVAADWFEVSNTGQTAIDITGWKMDDSSASFGASVALQGVTSIGAGQSVIFLEGTADTVAAFINTWFDGVAPEGVQFGYYAGSGIGLSTNGDGVTLFDSAGTQKAKVTFGAAPAASPFATFENSAAQDNIVLTSLSEDGVGGAFTIDGLLGGQEIGSPGTVGKVFISEVAPWSSTASSSPVAVDWFELSNTTSAAVNIIGWRMDDDSISFAESDPLEGVTSIDAGESVIFLNTNAAGFVTAKAAFIANWFDGEAPEDLQFGYYEGAGLGTGTGGDAIYLFDAAGTVLTGLAYTTVTAPPALATIDNAGGTEFAVVNTVSSPGTNGAFQITNTLGRTETGSPGTIESAPVAENAPPSAVELSNVVTSLAEGTNTPLRVKLADVAIIDDGNGFNALSLSGADADLFTVDASGLYLKAFTNLDFETKASYSVTVEASDPTLEGAPHASTTYTLNVTDVANETRGIAITEVAPWSSGESPVGEDWFEITNFGTTTIKLTGWTFDDDSADLTVADPLLGVSSLRAGQSAIFLNTDAEGFAEVRDAFIATWYNGTAPAGLTFGYYDGAGLGTGGDGVVLFDATGTVQANIAFGASGELAPFATFDNSVGADNVLVTALSVDGENGAFNALSDADEIGNPGSVGLLGTKAVRTNGTSGDNVLLGSTKRDNLLGLGGNDELLGGDDADRLNGNSGNDALYGGEGNDRLYGEVGEDRLYGEDGDDQLYGDTPSDQNNDEGFADIFVFDSNDGNDKVFDFEVGIDKVELTDGGDFALTYRGGNTILTYGDTTVRFYGATLTEDDLIFPIG